MKVKEALKNLEQLEVGKATIEKRLQETFGKNKHFHQSTYHSVGYFFEDGVLKFFMQNLNNNKTVLYFSDLQTLINDLKKIKEEAENTELQLEKRGEKK